MTTAVHLDELETARHLGDCERDAVWPMVPYLHGIGGFCVECTVLHFNGRIFHTSFPDNWRATMLSHGYPDDEDAEQFLVSLAWVEFLRRTR